MAFRLRVGQRLDEIDARHAEAIEVPDEVDRILLGADVAREARPFGGPDEDPELLSVWSPDIGRGDRRGALHFAALSCCGSPRSTSAWTVVSILQPARQRRRPVAPR